MASLADRLHSDLPLAPVTLDLDEIQGTVLRYRPEPYYGTHAMLRVDAAADGRELLRRLAPHVDSAADWWQAGDAWIAAALTYSGLEAVGVPEDSLRSFPEPFREGPAGRADLLRDSGANAPENWDEPFGSGQVHIQVSIFSDTEDKWHRSLDIAMQQLEGLTGITLVVSHDFGAQPGSQNPFGYKDLIGQPAIEGSGVDPLPGQGAAIKAGEFILGYPGQAGTPHPMPEPEILGRNGTFVGVRKYQSLVATFNRFVNENSTTPAERELLAAKLVGRWRSGAPLTVAPDTDDPELGEDPMRNNDFTYADDPHGRQVPFGAHMRRMNPRDTRLAILTDVSLHRIIRRSTTFGAPYDPEAISDSDDEVERGLYFIWLGARAMETMEFLQQEWINSGNFTDLGDERDPIIGLQGEAGTFTIPRDPVRHRIHGIETFNVLRGSEYLFMPSLPALTWLAELV